MTSIIDKDSQLILGEQQIKYYGQFIKNHQKLLTKCEKDMKNECCFYNNSENNQKLNQCESIAIDFNLKYESLEYFELINSGNIMMNKIIIVFAQLLEECNWLKEKGLEYQLNFMYIDAEDISTGCSTDTMQYRQQTQQLNNDNNEQQINNYRSQRQQEQLIRFSKRFEFLCEIHYYLERCVLVGKEIINQLGALFSEEKIYLNTNSSIHFQSVFSYLADIAVILIRFDIIFKNAHLNKYWKLLNKSINSISQNVNKFSKLYKENDINGLENALNQLELLFSGDLFQNFIDSTFSIKQQTNSKALIIFSSHFNGYLKNAFNEIQKKYSNDITECNETEELIKINAMCILYHNIFGNVDDKLVKQLIEINCKYCGITIIGNIIWKPEKFIKKHGSTLLKGHDKYLNDIKRIRKIYLQMKTNNLIKETHTYCLQISLWILKITNNINSNNNIKLDELRYRCSLILEGIQFMGQISFIIKSITNLHILQKIPMQKICLASICKLIEYLKCMKILFHENSKYFGDTIHCVVQHMQHQILFLIDVAKKKLMNNQTFAKTSPSTTTTTTTTTTNGTIGKGKTISCTKISNVKSSSPSIIIGASTMANNERNIDILTALKLAEKCLYGPTTKKRILLTRLSLSIADPNRIFTNEQLQKLTKILQRIEMIIDLQLNIDKLCNSTFMHWPEIMLPIYTKQYMDIGMDIDKIEYMLHSMTDCEQYLNVINEINIKFCNEEILKTNNDISPSTSNDIFNIEIIQKLCGQIETRLRLDVHFTLNNNFDVTTTNIKSFDNYLNINNNGGFNNKITTANDNKSLNYDQQLNLIQLKPLQLYNNVHLQIKPMIEHYLSTMFYNLTTVSLHDWRTYGEMRCLATTKYNLQTIEDHLPTQTLEQGLDVLEIMRNIHVFVSKYLYNLNNQVFIESNSNNKHLNTINIRHIANSLRTHGTGIINTTVNFTYQFLRKKFAIFSQFLYDERIKSRLMKDLKYFRDNKEKNNQMYGYERADNFNKGIKRLGLSADGLSHLDLFRQLISHIGNAMGYVRMMRSGGINCCSNASVFLPKFDDTELFLKMVIDENQSDCTINAAKNVECNIKNVSRNYAEGSDYFKLLVDVFSSFLCNSKNAHLRNFYLIIPPLTINFIEYILTAKDKISKKDKRGALFTDDGFAMGLAYILKLLNQTGDFNSLHWFKSVRNKYKKQADAIQEQIIKTQKYNAQSSMDDKLQQTLLLTEKRINMFLQEFDLLYCNLSSARIFFQ